MKLDELSRLAANAAADSPDQKWERVCQAVKEHGTTWNNMYRELEMSHRYVDAYRHESLDGGQVPLHSHNFFELLHFDNSCGIEYLLGRSRYRLQRGDLVFTPPCVNHQPLLNGQLVQPCRRDVIWVSREFMTPFRILPLHSAIDWDQPFLLRTANTPWEVLGEKFHSSVQEALQRAPGWETFVIGNTMILLTLLARALSGQGGAVLVQAEEPELLEQVLSYIEAHMSEPITLSDTARHFWVSESKISHIFRQKMDSSFHRCVTQRRLIEAKSLIAQGTALSEVQERVGFSDYSTFFRAFKREYGISPSEFREIHGSGQAAAQTEIF